MRFISEAYSLVRIKIKARQELIEVGREEKGKS